MLQVVLGLGVFTVGGCLSTHDGQAGPPRNRVFVDQFGEYVEDPVAFYMNGGLLFFPEPNSATEDKLTCWIPDADSGDSISDLGGDCEADGIFSGTIDFDLSGDPADLFPSKWCRRPGCVD